MLGEAVDLLERIADDRRCSTAIADGTFGIMKRPADRGKGLDGVVEHGAGLLQPGHRDPGGAGRGGRAHDGRSIVRPYGDTTGDGMVQVSFTLPVPHDKRAEGAALQLADKMGMDPAMLVHAKAMGAGFTSHVYGSGKCTPRRLRIARNFHNDESDARDRMRSAAHRTLRDVTEDIEGFHWNTMVAKLMELTNVLMTYRGTSVAGLPEWDEAVSLLLLMLAPSAPHITEELWSRRLAAAGRAVVVDPPRDVARLR